MPAEQQIKWSKKNHVLVPRKRKVTICYKLESKADCFILFTELRLFRKKCYQL